MSVKFVRGRWYPVAIALLIAAVVRVCFILAGPLSFESDEAIVGLMARHILYLGEHPLFYYGQSYLGPLEPASAALAFVLAGPSVFALRAAPAVYSLIFLGFTAEYARRAFGATAGAACLAYLAVPPLFLLTWSVKARGGYSELIALGAIVLVLALELGTSKAPPFWIWPALGLIGGLALWTDPLAVVYLGPAAIYLGLLRGRRIVSVGPFAALVGFLVGAGPLLLANLSSHGATWRELAGPNAAQAITLVTYRHNLASTLRESVPTMLGFFQASSNLPAFAAARTASFWPTRVTTGLAVLLAIVAVGFGLASLWRAIRRRPDPQDLLIWVGASTILLFCSSQQEILYLTEPRYLLPLYALAPIAAKYWTRLWTRRRAVALTVVALVLAVNVNGILRANPALDAPHLSGQIVQAGDPSLAAFLEARQIQTFYANYWLTYPVAFQSQERVIPSVIDDQLRVGFNRYIPYAIAVARSPDPAVVVVANSPAEARLEAYLRSTGRAYRIGHWRNLDVFDRITPPFRPRKV